LALQERSRKEQRGWYFYDWANSAFPTTVVTLFFGPYLTSLAKAAAGADGYVRVLGLSLAPESVWSYLVSLSVVTQVIAFPLVGAIADYSGRKRELLGLLAYSGAGATVFMFVLEGDNYLLGCILFLVANFAFGASIVIYNAFLPEIAPAGERDAVSSNGWALGYLGGGLLLGLNLLLYGQAETIGLAETAAVRISLASAGLWWGFFTIIPLRQLKNRGARRLPVGRGYLSAGLSQLGHTLRDIRKYPQSLLFLLAFLIYNDGIQTVITLAGQFGSEALGLSMELLTISILLAQVVALFGALGFKYVARWIGAKNAVAITLVMWSAVLVYAYGWVNSAGGFLWMAAAVGLVMGGSQALSRSIFSFLIPPGKEAEYFSLYEISDKGTSWLGPLIYGLALQFTGDYGLAIISLLVFFICGLILLLRVDLRSGAIAAGNTPPPVG
jgi:UMF1 family MFS transporter